MTDATAEAEPPKEERAPTEPPEVSRRRKRDGLGASAEPGAWLGLLGGGSGPGE